MEVDGSHATEKVWNLTLEILFLLTREIFPPVKSGDRVTITVSPPPSLTPETRTMQKILEVANKITELLAGEISIRCQDVVIEEREFLGHKNDILEDRLLPLSPGGCSTTITPERSPRPHYSQDSTQEVTPHHYQTKIEEAEFVMEDTGHTGFDRDVTIDIKVESSSRLATSKGRLLGGCGNAAAGEETGVKSNDWCQEEECSSVIGANERCNLDNSEEHNEIDEFAAKSEGVLTLYPHPKPNTTDLSSHPFALRSNESDSLQLYCSACGNCFSQKLPLIHNDQDHTEMRPSACPECGKCVSWQSDLSSYETLHTRGKPYSCSVRGKGISRKPGVIQPGRPDTGEKPYSCFICGKCFPNRSQLSSHERVHTGEKPYSCSECGKSFSQKSNLFTHEKLHTGEKKYSCSQCGKSFSQKAVLIRHERVHTGEKPFSCSECGKSFSRKSRLIEHVRVHTGYLC